MPDLPTPSGPIDSPESEDFINQALASQQNQRQQVMLKLLAEKAKKDKIRAMLQGQGALADNLDTLRVQDPYDTANEAMPAREPTYADADRWAKMRQLMALQKMKQQPQLNVQMGRPIITQHNAGPQQGATPGSSVQDITDQMMLQQGIDPETGGPNYQMGNIQQIKQLPKKQ